jgi:drug/metabolite transporter (DMT)-like permease
MRTALLLTIALIFQAFGNVSLSGGMKSIGSSITADIIYWPALIISAASNPFIWLGVMLLLVVVLLLSIVLSWADLSFVLPITSVEIVLNVALAYWLLGEAVTLRQWTGTLIIAIGVAFVVRSAHSGRSSAGA